MGDVGFTEVLFEKKKRIFNELPLRRKKAMLRGKLLTWVRMREPDLLTPPSVKNRLHGSRGETPEADGAGSTRIRAHPLVHSPAFFLR